MWIVLAFASAVFAALTSILAKCGIKKTDSTVATAIRTVVVLVFSFVMVLIVGSLDSITSIDKKTLIFLVLSGIATGASWLCYFKALQNGNVNKVVPIDKSSTVLTVLLAFVVLNEKTGILKLSAVALIGIGTFMMIEKKDISSDEQTKKGSSWLVYALLSALFASLSAILSKMGISGVESNLGTMIRTVVVLIMSWAMVFLTGKQSGLKKVEAKELRFILLSGLATGASWLCYYSALKDGLISVVVPIDKLSIVLTVAFSYIVFKEKLSVKAFFGLCIIVFGTVLMLL